MSERGVGKPGWGKALSTGWGRGAGPGALYGGSMKRMLKADRRQIEMSGVDSTKSGGEC